MASEEFLTVFKAVSKEYSSIHFWTFPAITQFCSNALQSALCST